MARMLGEKFLPESVQERRRQVRERAMSLREPVRNFREQNVPGPDILGRVESRVTSLRDRAVSRDSVLERIRMRRSGDGGSGDSGNSGSGNSSGDSNNNSGMNLT